MDWQVAAILAFIGLAFASLIGWRAGWWSFASRIGERERLIDELRFRKAQFDTLALRLSDRERQERWRPVETFFLKSQRNEVYQEQDPLVPLRQAVECARGVVSALTSNRRTR